MRAAGLVCEEIVVFELQYVVQQPDLVRIKVPLPDLDLGEGAPGHVAAPELQLRRQTRFLWTAAALAVLWIVFSIV